MRDIEIRIATSDDLQAINGIYNHYVPRSTCTYQDEPETIESRRAWFAARDASHPITVAAIEGETVGWGALSPFHHRSAYRRTVENAVYVHHMHQRRGIGRRILSDLTKRARALDHHTIIALVDSEQTASIALHESLGFRQAADLREVGFKFDRWLHVRYLQLML